MPEKLHIILGLSVDTPKMVKELQMQGKKDIYVMDYEQPITVKERGGIFYISPDGALLVASRTENITFHRYLCIKRHKDID